MITLKSDAGENGIEKRWKLGDIKPFMTGDNFRLHATDDDLMHIIGRFEGIPSIRFHLIDKAKGIMWRDEIAKFIYDNLV